MSYECCKLSAKTRAQFLGIADSHSLPLDAVWSELGGCYEVSWGGAKWGTELTIDLTLGWLAVVTYLSRPLLSLPEQTSWQAICDC